LLTEISSIQNEIKEWGVVSNDNYEARENMLRGSVSLDLTMLVMRALFELIGLLSEILRLEEIEETRTGETSGWSVFTAHLLLAQSA
jgi:hypothetical protein